MKVLILTVTMGQGHNSTANALHLGFLHRGIESTIVDMIDYISPKLTEPLNQGYITLATLSPATYGFFFRQAELKKKTSDGRSLAGVIYQGLSKKFEQMLDDYHPDAIICTHFFAAGIIDALKLSGAVTAKSIAIMTDFCLTPYFEDFATFDYFVAPNEHFSLRAAKKGIYADKFLPFGIPIHPKFSKSMNQKEAREKLGIDPDRKTVLIMSGSMGYGDIHKTIKKIDYLKQQFQVIAICGNNAKVQQKIKKMNTEKTVHCYGFVKNIDVMMDASDCLISKPGGITTSEALAKGLPMIMVNPIKGQEERNVEFMLNMGAAVFVTKTWPIDEALFQMLHSDERIQRLKEMMKLVAKPDATDKLCDFVMSIFD